MNPIRRALDMGSGFWVTSGNLQEHTRRGRGRKGLTLSGHHGIIVPIFFADFRRFLAHLFFNRFLNF